MKASLLIAIVALVALVQQSAACSEGAFRRAIAKFPNSRVSLQCKRAVYNKLCGRCGDNMRCFWKSGPKVAPTLKACRQGRSLRTLAAKCSEQAFQRAVAAAPKNGVALKCQRAVYEKLCGRCGNDVGCYWNYGPKVAPTLRACRHRRSLRTLTTKCSESGFKKAIEQAPKTGASLSCQRAVYNALCEECGNSFKCFMQKGPSVARKLPLCRPRELTKYDLADEEVGGRSWGRICATAACLFIDGLNPPPARYTPGPNPIAPIHRPADMMYDSANEKVGHYKLPHEHHDPRGWPGHDMAEFDMAFDKGDNWRNTLREKWGYLSWGFSNTGTCTKERFNAGVKSQKTYQPTKVPRRCQVAIFRKCCNKCNSGTCFRECALEGGSSIVNACS